jgi:hypothetical protein
LGLDDEALSEFPPKPLAFNFPQLLLDFLTIPITSYTITSSASVRSDHLIESTGTLIGITPEP